MAKKKSAATKTKSSKDSRTLNPPTGAGKKVRGAPASDQDVKRRIGHFVGAGEPYMLGSRTSGIGGQSVQKARTDKKKTKK